jgi:hypothetical protein
MEQDDEREDVAQIAQEPEDVHLRSRTTLRRESGGGAVA